MHALLRHLAGRLWATLAVGGLLSIWMLPWSQRVFGLEWLLVEVLLVFALCFAFIGWLLRRWADSRINALVQEASGFERDALTDEALDCYQRAMGYLDSFLLSPRYRRKLSVPVARRLARFHLARTDEQALENFIPAYLTDHPQDVEVAEYWVQHTGHRGGFREAHQDLAARLSSAHPDNLRIQRVLARFFLFLERTDFPALAAYRCVWNETPPPGADFVRELARLFLRDRRVDEWALETYLKAHKAGVPRDELIDALAACVLLLPDGPAVREYLVEARRLMAGMPAADIEARCEAFRPQAPAGARRKEPPGGEHPWRRLRRLPAELAAAAGSATGAALQQLKAVVGIFRRSARARRVAGLVFLTVVLAAVGLFTWNTMRHLTAPAPLPAADAVKAPPPEAVDPFTLQVAAYLNQDYAKRYVAELKRQGLDAYWNTAVSGEKRWYQVRISHFATKQQALELGESLKSRGVIDDFYVANYRAVRTK